MTRDLRFVRADRDLLAQAAAEEIDPLTAEMCSGESVASHLLAVPDLAWCMLGRGRVLATAGLVPHWPGRAEAWMLRSRLITSREFVFAMWRCKAVLDARQRDPTFRRIEMFCRRAPWNMVFATRLGFTLETPNGMRAWDTRGRDHMLFSRVAEF